MQESFDDIVIGTGQAGPSLAARLAGEGRRVAVIERGPLGGTCVNVGCTPTKALVASARVAHMARRAREFGIELDGAPKANMAEVRARVADISRASRDGLEGWLEGTEGLELIRGHGRLSGPREVTVATEDGERRLQTERIFLNVGTRARAGGIDGLGDTPFLTNASALALEELPQHLIVVGGSYIGLEFGQAFRRLGSEVTVVERGARLIGREDEAVSDAVAAFLKKEGVQLRFGAECMAARPAEGGVELSLDCDGEGRTVRGSHLLLAIGREPNTDDLGLDAAGIATDRRGYVTADDSLRTSVDGIWALGDCNGRGAFTHTAYNDFEVVAAQLFDDDRPKDISGRIPCYGLYVDPPLGRVGMTTAEARKWAAESGRQVQVAELPMSRVGRAKERSETNGLMRILIDSSSEEILGAAILGIRGDEVAQSLLVAMASGTSYKTIANTMLIHPTVTELIPTALQRLRPLE